MNKQKKKFFNFEQFKNGELYVKLSFTILFVVIFIISFFSFEGYKHFYSVVYADQYKGYNFQIHTINVEQGDCFLIRLPNKQCMLIDAGQERYANRVTEYIKQFFITEDIDKIDYFVFTHPDSDHIGGAVEVINNFKVDTILRAPVYSASSLENMENQSLEIDKSETYEKTMSTALNKNINVEFFYKGLTLKFGGCLAQFLSPDIKAYNSSNNYSAVIMFSEQTKKFLFMGDAESEIEQLLINEYASFLDADLLKVGHHGSYTSTSQNFLDIVSPELALISCSGSSNYFPHTSVKQRLVEADVEILSTAELENFVVAINNDNLIWSMAKREPNYLVLIFCVILTIVMIIWENPFKKLKSDFFTKKEYK